MSEWISVEDRLPVSGEAIWIYCPEDEQQVGYYEKDVDWGEEGVSHLFRSTRTDDYRVVTHWMPLPELPAT